MEHVPPTISQRTDMSVEEHSRFPKVHQVSGVIGHSSFCSVTMYESQTYFSPRKQKQIECVRI